MGLHTAPRSALVAFCSLLLLACLTPGFLPESDKIYSYEVEIVYRNRGDEPWMLSDGDVAFPLFADNPWQEVSLKWTSEPIENVVQDCDGNLWALLQVPDRTLEPGESIGLRAKYEFRAKPREAPDLSMEASGRLSDIPSELREAYCGQAACWLTDDEELRALAYDLANGKQNVLEIICSFVSWIHDHVVYETYELPRYPNETYSELRGDCDDQANLLITLCRVMGIPAYLQVGCIYYFSPTPYEMVLWDGHLRVKARNVAWHGWALVFVPPWGWLPVDLTASIGIDEDPLNAIRTAIVWEQETILCYEIKVTDYVANAREQREQVLEHDIYIYEEESMFLIRTETSLERMAEFIRMVSYYTALVFVVLSITGLVVGVIYILRARRERATQMAPYSLYHS